MPAKGGAAGKVGDQYEAHWTVDAALRVIDGRAEHVVYESLDPDESRGVEFSLRTAAGDIEFWSLKRQTAAAAGWTLAALTRSDEQGRSILGDLVAHVERDARNVAVFASTLGAARLEEMRSVAATAGSLQQRLDQSAPLRADFDRMLRLFDGDKERARQFLTRMQIRTADEISLRTQIESTIALLFYSQNGGSVDASAIRRLLAEYLLDHMHEKIDRKILLDHLATYGYRRRDWAVDTTVREKVDALCEAYMRPLQEQLIGGTLQTLPGADKLLGADGLPIAQRTLITGGAGGGKSSESAHVVERLRATGIPVLPIRMDVIDEGLRTPQRLGRALSLPASPVAVLAGLADGGDCVLIIDQLDAVSLASGRRTEVWSLFEQLLTEADGYPKMRVIVACRAFDLEHDHRMRSLKAKASAFKVVTIESFDPKKVKEILGDRRVHLKLRPLLVVPLHLAMFLSLEGSESEGLETRDQLFTAFWREKQRRCSQRLGRNCEFAGVVDWLAQWLSEHQELSAPADMLPDEFREDADALASEHVLVLADGRYRFFHETFFDYAFARGFAQRGERLLDLLLSDEQHLFRRAQVRQVLSFLRSANPQRYENELQSVLSDCRVRFHIKRVVFQLLSATTDPTQAERTLLREVEDAHPDWAHQVNRVISNHVGWFDVIDATDFLETGLSSDETKKQERIVWLFAMPEILQHRSVRVAALLRQHRRNDDEWQNYLRFVCRTGDIFYSRELFDLFLSLIHDGTLDGTRPGFAVNDNWWSILYSMGEEAPAMVCETIAAWFDRKLEAWGQAQSDSTPVDQQLNCGEAGGEGDIEVPDPAASLWQYLGEDGNDDGVIAKAAEASLAFAEQILPRVASFVEKHAKPCRDRLDVDPLWSFRSYGEGDYQVYDSLFKSLARALEDLARSAPDDLDRLLDPYTTRLHDSIAYLVLRAWSAVPERYGERLARYLVEEPRRLKVGYASWSGESTGAGVASDFRSIEAVRAASRTCSPETFAALEATIVGLRDDWEARHPRQRGLRQLQLLTAMDQSRLGAVGHSKLAELQTKFPNITHEPPKAMEVVCVGSPISADAQEKMTDDQWLNAMVKYSGIDRRREREVEESGGEFELAYSLESKTKADPKRFVKLTERMTSDYPASYFDAILRGVAATAPPEGSSIDGLSLSDIISLIERAHALPGHPCGRCISHLIEKWSKLEWPRAIVEIVAWYAVEDPDPTEEKWRDRAPSGQFYNGGDPDMSGLNSTRGSGANAIAALLLADRGPADVLTEAVERLAHDVSIAVRSQAIYGLLALLKTQPDLAIPWFKECVSADEVLLKTRFVQYFVNRAARHDYSMIRTVIRQMVASEDEEVVEAGSRLCCLIALDVESAETDAEHVRCGLTLSRRTGRMRLPSKVGQLMAWFRYQRRAKSVHVQVRKKAAASIYATNVADKAVGQYCRNHVLRFF